MSGASREPAEPLSSNMSRTAHGQDSALSKSLNEAVPFRPKEPVEPDFIQRLRARLEKVKLAEAARDSVAMVLPETLGIAVRTFDPPKLFLRAEVGYIEPGTSHRIDVAWPAKRIGIRVLGPHLGDRNHLVPAPISVDAALRERAWLILPVDPDAGNSVEQVERALRVVKRMGVYRR